MRQELLGLELEHALAILEKEGITPTVTLTSAPKRAQESGGVLRVVYASDDGASLTAARFMDPIFDLKKENG